MKWTSVALLLAAACATGGAMPDRQTRIDALMQAYSDPHAPGTSVLVVKDGATVVRRSYGQADLEAGIAATPRTNYRLASVTKQFTALAILILFERGKLSLDDPISRFFPEFPPYGAGVTVRQLLTHTSGLPDYEDYMPEGLTVPLKDADVLRIVEQNPRPRFRPGAAYRYSNSGYSLLALVVQRASGKDFATFLHDEIFAPLGMTGSVAFENGTSAVSNRAYGYSRKATGWIRTDQSMTSSVLGDGGVYTSIDDLVRWEQELASPHIIRAETLQQAFTPAVRTDLPGSVDYGFGWRISDYRGHHAVWHTGETIGFRNAILRFPEGRLTVVVLTNRNEGDPIDLAHRIADLYQKPRPGTP
jgi:CubicO group peptidase (beta-lactamase class C family)